nr:acetyl-CoA carboxylase biotin carboxyl carrier protein subunit [Niveispirillum sp. SYP-B3756]
MFDLAAHEEAWVDEADAITSFRTHQQVAFTAEVARWQTDEAGSSDAADEAPPPADDNAVQADISGNVWKVLVEPGQWVEPGQPLVVLEAMKMEFSIQAKIPGRIAAIHCRAGRPVTAGDALLSLEAIHTKSHEA